MPLFRVMQPGMLTLVQDLGRRGLSAIGVARGGAADPLSLRIGNRLVENADGAPALEMTMVGGSFAFEHDAVIALTGGQACAVIETTQPHEGTGLQQLPNPRADTLNTSSSGTRRDVPLSCPVLICKGECLTIGPIARGVRTYLCIGGGISVPEVLGSASTHLGAGFGGVFGRALKRGDAMEFGTNPTGLVRPVSATAATRLVEATLERRVLRAVDGAHASAFDVSAFDGFWNRSFTVSNCSDRVGVRLLASTATESNEPPARSPSREPGRPRDTPGPRSGLRTGEMTSEGMMCGAVQVPPDGEPIILMVDHPTTGGYPVIACVATVDLPVLGQLRPGVSLRFERISLDKARELFRQRERELDP